MPARTVLALRNFAVVFSHIIMRIFGFIAAVCPSGEWVYGRNTQWPGILVIRGFEHLCLWRGTTTTSQGGKKMNCQSSWFPLLFIRF